METVWPFQGIVWEAKGDRVWSVRNPHPCHCTALPKTFREARYSQGVRGARTGNRGRRGGESRQNVRLMRIAAFSVRIRKKSIHKQGNHSFTDQ
jgi:hypothetical protein